MCRYPLMLRKSGSGAPVDLLECWQMRISKDQTHSSTAVNIPRLPALATIPESGISEVYRKRAILNLAVIPFNSVSIAVQSAAIFGAPEEQRWTCLNAGRCAQAKIRHIPGLRCTNRLSHNSYHTWVWYFWSVQEMCHSQLSGNSISASIAVVSKVVLFSDAPGGQLRRTCELAWLFPDTPK